MGLSIDQDLSGRGGPYAPALTGDTYARISACGRSFGRGAFRFHDSLSGPAAKQWVLDAFPALGGVVDVVAFDWLGRQYAVVAATATPSGVAEVVLLDPHDMSLTPVAPADGFLGFFASPPALDLVEVGLLASWFAASGTEHVEFDRCVAPRVPAFLGGGRAVGDLEDADPDVYWTICTQLHAQLPTPHHP